MRQPFLAQQYPAATEYKKLEPVKTALQLLTRIQRPLPKEPWSVTAPQT